ncbi:hypothetical protein D1007_56570 [Hordeum vulgare]|nr:hypothetical protein D1007_56570 [Hordeum vulgare]
MEVGDSASPALGGAAAVPSPGASTQCADWAEDEDRQEGAAVAAGGRTCFGDRLAEVIAAERVASYEFLDSVPDHHHGRTATSLQAGLGLGVTPISNHEFTAIFPDPASIRFGTHIDELTLALNKLTVNISVSDVDPLAVVVLDPVWMQLRGLPSIAKQAKVIRKMSCLLGKILEIDEASLFRPVVRAKVLTHDSSKLQTTVRIFFNRAGYNIRISVEDMGPLAAGSEAPGTGPPGPLVDGDAAKAPTRPSVDLRGHHPPTMRMMMRHQPCSPTLRLAWASLPWSSRLRWGRTRLCGSRRTRRSPVARCCHPLRTLQGRATRAAWDWRFARLPPPAEVLRWLSALP